MQQVQSNDGTERLRDELLGYPGVAGQTTTSDGNDPVLFHRLLLRDQELAFFSTVTTFGSANDIVLAELTIEAFYPANEQSAALLERPPRV